MKRQPLLIAIFLSLIFLFGGCKGMHSEARTYTSTLIPNYDYAIIKLANGKVIEGKVEAWTSGRGGIDVNIDGIVYFVSYHNCTLICNEP